MTEAVNFNPDWFTDRLRKFQGFREMLQGERSQMLMLVESPPKRGKTWLLQQMAYQCRQEAIPVVYINLREPQIKRVDEFQFVQLLSESFGAPQYFGPLFAEVGRQ